MPQKDPVAQVLVEVGARVREERLAADLSQEFVAAEAGIDYKRFQRIEKGQNVTVRTLARIATAMGSDFWSLMSKPPTKVNTALRRSTRRRS